MEPSSTHRRFAGIVARRVTLNAGESRTVILPLDTNELGFWSPQTHRWSIEPGAFDLWTGQDSNASDHLAFTVTQ
ncbi:fibronectin type III-like domain-contianing protein [Granulicella arctica]|uniref:Fibronectin type III-like domain-containing protein n=1 Tax=Granulicella arctica TaxID=940613 RepID=A0A7Y9PEE6_9BACT|nr:fibronectin type III-like domain-contianing protein [Granulicella arctica]NYF78180.1 hypothetical protein [Granulicella arctica]